MPKFVPPSPPRLRRLLACTLSLCALSLVAGRLALAQRPSNALPPSDPYAPAYGVPTATPSATSTPAATPTPRNYYPYAQGTPQPEGTPRPYEPYPYAQGTPTATPTLGAQPSSSLEEFLDGRNGPVSIKLSEADAGWKSLRVLRTGAPRATAPAPSRGGGTGDAVVWRALQESFGGGPDVFLTRGRTVRVNGDEHLVVYRAAFPTQEETSKWLEARAQMIAPASQRQQPSWEQVQRVVRDFLDTVPVRSSLLSTRRIAGFDSIEEFRFEERFARFSDLIEPEFRKSQPRPGRPLVAPTPRVQEPQQEPQEPRIVPELAPQRVPIPDAVAQQAASEPMRRLFSAVQRYRADNNDMLPPMEDLAQAQAALSAYLSGDSWRDPVSGRFFLPNARLSGRRMVHLKPFASSLILFYSEPDLGGKRTVLRLDGIVRRVSPSEWDRLIGTASVQ